VITGGATIDSAIDATRGGALDYLTKPIDGARLATALLNVSRTRALKKEVGSLRSDLRGLGRFGRMVGRSKAMLEIYDLIARVGPNDATVFVTGESGGGAGRGDRSQLSPRRSGLLVPVNRGRLAEPDRASCSATSGAASPARTSSAKATSSARPTARSSWTRSARCRTTSR
jgi:DNA-binding NtrC family response regulator